MWPSVPTAKRTACVLHPGSHGAERGAGGGNSQGRRKTWGGGGAQATGQGSPETSQAQCGLDPVAIPCGDPVSPSGTPEWGRERQVGLNCEAFL